MGAATNLTKDAAPVCGKFGGISPIAEFAAVSVINIVENVVIRIVVLTANIVIVVVVLIAAIVIVIVVLTAAAVIVVVPVVSVVTVGEPIRSSPPCTMVIVEVLRPGDGNV